MKKIVDMEQTEPKNTLANANNKSDLLKQVEKINKEDNKIEDNFVIETIDTDEELLAIFLEETHELATEISKSFAIWKEEPTNIKILRELQRYLHTIKGGARMVGIRSIGDLTHELESIYERFVNKEIIPTTAWLNVMQVAQDILSMQIESLENHAYSFFTQETIKQLQTFIQLKNLPEDAKLITPSLNSVEQTQVILDSYNKNTDDDYPIYDTSVMPQMLGDFGEFKEVTDTNSEVIRIPAPTMEQMINLSSESVINRTRVEMGVNSLSNIIAEMGTTVQRLAEQLRQMDTELEAQILSQLDDTILLENENFDPLEMDQYSSLNQLSKSLSESVSDLLDIKSTLLEKTRDNESLLLQLSHTQAELQDNLMNSRIVPFSRLTPRLERIVRQIANELNKQVHLTLVNADDEMDRNILERVASPLEHMLRNAVDHGIETPEKRVQAGKNRIGQVKLSVSREANEIVIELSDDGQGIDVKAVRKQAINQGLIDPNDDSLTDIDIMQYIFNAGLTTTKKVTQISGRGVGMDVVRSEIRQLGGVVSVNSSRGKGSRFIIRIPLKIAISDAFVVRVADKHYIIPLVQIERVEQVSSIDLLNYYQSERHTFTISNTEYRLYYLNEILTGSSVNELSGATVPVIIVKNQTGQNVALQVDEVIGSRIEVVVKPLGKQLSRITGISSATIMGDGSIMLILDLIALIRNAPMRKISKINPQNTADTHKKILVIDDSVTVRKVTSRFLKREGFDVIVAKDGVDALKVLLEYTPDIILLDIEMPRMDGFEVATQIRHNERLKNIPIIMITSRTGDKHRKRAVEIGVNNYLGKPFQENVLLDCINKELTSG
ncbi:MAG: response regulator [Moraxellaceae bacterium]|nr:response regulator [Moraxellaceae bacterium]